MTGTNTKRMILLPFILVSFIAKTTAQDNKNSPSTVNHEKIYIHFDRPNYVAGETIWFKAYLYNNNLPSLLSDELYLQLEDGKGKIISKKKYPIIGATVPGSIGLSDTLPQGYYILKAITRAIIADDPLSFYTISIFVFNPGAAAKTTAAAKKNISLRFFAESGHLIDRIKTQVAFKAMDEIGNPVAVNGFIKSDSTTIVTPFKTFHDGIGKISFTPHLTDTFFAEIVFNGTKYKFPLPPVEAAGVYLKIAEADSGKTFVVTRSRTDKELFDTIKLIVKMNNDTVFENTIAFDNEQSLTGTLSTRNISSGILHFIILNKRGVPMAERLSFVNNNEYLLQPDFVILKRDSSKRGANNFSLKFSDTIQRSFSIAVTDFAAQEYPDKESICSRLLLTSDLKGYVYNAAYYFESNDAVHREALDNLMLTHGWTRYNWKKTALANYQPAINNHLFLLSISGTVLEAGSEKAVSNGSLSMNIMTEDSGFHSFDIPVDRNGRFKIDSLLFFGNAKVFYNYASASGKRIPVNLYIDKDKDESLFPPTSNNGYQNITGEKGDDNLKIPAPYLSNLFFEGKYKQLGTVFLKTKIKRPEDRINEKYTSSLYRGVGEVILDNINKPYANKSLDVISYALTNIHTLGYDKDYNSLVNKKNFSLQKQKNWIVEVLLDENVSNIDNAKTISMDKVALIKFYEAGFVGVSSQAPGGALAIYLKKFDDEQLTGDRQNYLVIKGYPVNQEFYNPDYSGPARNGIAPDNRLTLYWNTSSSVSKDIKLNFFNNDISKKLSIIVEGFDARGRLIHFEKVIGE